MSTFIPEDGTGIAGANSLCDLAFARAYFTARGLLDDWDGDDVDPTDQQGWLVQGTDYLEQMWRPRLMGSPATLEQGLFYPAKGVFVEIAGCWKAVEGVPDAAKRAVCEYALLAKNGRLFASSQAGAVISESRTGGGISRSVTYATASGRPSYPAGDRWLQPLLAPVAAVRT
jgi:hypothetical protein